MPMKKKCQGMNCNISSSRFYRNECCFFNLIVIVMVPCEYDRERVRDCRYFRDCGWRSVARFNSPFSPLFHDAFPRVLKFSPLLKD